MNYIEAHNRRSEKGAPFFDGENRKVFIVPSATIDLEKYLDAVSRFGVEHASDETAKFYCKNDDYKLIALYMKDGVLFKKDII